ncbi:hypothetical protein PGTUg99_021826 [Puccinia graminis f. sp. tritici]|uniref:Uncharacterized protein n=1 Tax=Puccinia graminis f. sp. tritici TaxID=56615 RepID=A0A5B0NE81_PUCGR|nr:hypothetical protein PGTUg99_021826 [Puccinia graminis f. sp. tritici]
MDDDYQRMRSLDNGACANPNPHFTGFTDSEETCGPGLSEALRGVWLMNIGEQQIETINRRPNQHNLDFFSVAVCEPYSPSALGSLKASSRAAL